VSWNIETSCGNEAAKVADRVSIYLQGKGLDLGCGPWKIQPNIDLRNSTIGVDAYPGADVCANVADLEVFADEHFDFLFSSHALEDFKNTEATLRVWWNKIKVGGTLILYLPLTQRVAKEMGLDNWQDFYPNKGEQGANLNHQQDFVPAEIRAMVERIGHAEVLADEVRGDRDEYSFLQVFKKLSSSKLPIQGIEVSNKKRALVIRYGAIGDMIQTSPVFRLVKEQGYHVTANVSDYGLDVLKHNPHIDELAIQRRNQVDPKNLKKYWADLEKRYDLFINLTGAAEDNLLLPDRAMYAAMEEIRKIAPPEATDLQLMDLALKQFRKRVGGKNYYDSHLEMAGLPERGLTGELYFSESEELYAQYAKQRYKNNFVILWSLAGSAYHKWYPWFQHVVEKVLIDIPEAVVISVGEEACALMERAESARYLPRAGRWKWRHTLVMTKYVDLVVGPETGVLNAAGCFDTPKITLLSHSSHDNLCKYWKNDYCLAPEGVFCHPCHVLHFVHPFGAPCEQCHLTHTNNEQQVYGTGFWSCPYKNLHEDEEGIGSPFPICMAEGIPPERLIARIKEVHSKWVAAKEVKELVSIT